MKILKAHYEKIILALSLFLLIGIFVVHFLFQDDNDNLKKDYSRNSFFEIQKNKSNVEITFFRDIELMPGNFIFANLESGKTEQIVVDSASFKKRSNLLIVLNDGMEIEGRLSPNQDLFIKSDWKNRKGTINVDAEVGTKSIAFSQVEKISGSGIYSLGPSASTIDLEKATICIYQPKKFRKPKNDLSQRVKWQKKSEDTNASIYDTFTPPVIYLVNGRLTAKLPEEPIEENEKEPFGLELIDFSQRPYPHVLKRWIGNTPYFEDLNTLMAPNSNQNVFNRLEVGKTYRPNLGRKAGGPSLVECEKNHPDAKVSIEYFTVQQLKTKSGGSMQVGRAMVRDHELDTNPFEINSLMKEVFAGDYSIKLRFVMPGLTVKEFEFSEDQNGTDFEHESRKYQIEKIDIEGKSVLISKEAMITQPPQKIILSLPPVDPL